MKYTLIEDYFSTSIFQEIVQTYFDTVLGEILQKYPIIDAKGLFAKNDKVFKDDFDMPYHIHILNGLIPSLLIYEKHLIEKDWINRIETEFYIRTFILGYTFHDANKLLKINSLQDAIKELNKTIDEYASIKIFFPDFDKYKNDVYFLCLSDEDRTSVLANRYKIALSEIHVKETLALLCKFADSIASNQNLDSVNTFYKSISKSLSIISGINKVSISYVEINPNPYTLLSQNILQSARQVIALSGKKVFQSLRNGFVYFGEDLNETEIKKILLKATQVSSDIDHIQLTKIDYQECSFGFIGSINFTNEILSDITDKLGNKFWLLSPNGKAKIKNFNEFLELNTKLIEAYGLPIKINVKNDKLNLIIDKDNCDDEHIYFLKLFGLHKMQWLNARKNSKWKNDFNDWLKKDKELVAKIIISSTEEEPIEINTIKSLKKFLEGNVKKPNDLLKTYLNIIKTKSIIEEFDEIEIEEYLKKIENEIISTIEGHLTETNLSDIFFKRYFISKGNSQITTFDNFNPNIPEKKKMCLFTGGFGTNDYKDNIAFGLKATGFSNRTITSLNNKTSHISDLFLLENKLRNSKFSTPETNLLFYYDFFESTLDIDRDILKACVKAKDINAVIDGAIFFDKDTKFQYDINYNLNFSKLELFKKKKTDSSADCAFWLVRTHLLMTKKLAIRSYITGIMSPYIPHKEAFRYENAPRYIQQLGWDKVRLINVDSVLDEISLILTLGISQLKSNILKIAEGRNAYFTIYYLIKDDEDKKKVYDKLRKFINNNPKLFTNMTVTENLAELATNITMIGYNSSGSEETWLIRKALEYVRKEVKQGFGREDVIQKACGNIYKSIRLDEYVNVDAIKEFVTAVYDDLFVKEWKKKLPNLNREKDWIYQFAFLYKEKCAKKFDLISVKKIKDKLKDEGKELTEQNIRATLKGDKKENHSEKYINLILNKQ
jgi:CRISPR-associated protein Csc3